MVITLKIKRILAYCLILIGLTTFTHAQTIAEKKAGLGYVGSDLTEEMQKFLTQVNESLDMYHRELQTLYMQAAELYSQNATDESYKALLDNINGIKAQITELEERWRDMVTQSQTEGYALWHQPSTTLEQLVIDYGSQDYVYVIPANIASINVSVDSNLPIPRSSWNEMLELILSQNGVGIRQLNPYLRQLYLLKEDNSNLKLITNKRSDLEVLASNERIAFVLSPEPSDVRRSWFFLEKFVNPESTVLQMIGRDILIVAPVADVQELLKLYDFISANRGDKDYKVVTLSRVDAEEMAKILASIFGVLTDESTNVTELPKMGLGGGSTKPPFPRGPTSSNSHSPGSNDDNGLKVIPLTQLARAVFLVGTREEIRKAENIIREVEDQVGESRGKVIYWYTVKNSNAEELAEVLQKIYTLMIASGSIEEEVAAGLEEGLFPPPPPDRPIVNQPPIRRPYDEGYFLDDRFVINKTRPRPQEQVNQDRDNFIVDMKTGSIAMVVEAEVLPKLKELIKKLDVPKKMVQIEVLLFEKRLLHQDNFGLNLLRIGTEASQTNTGSALFNNIFPVNGPPQPGNAGVFEFLFSRKKHSGIPAYDIAYRFLISQEDVQINASPSILAVNQTPAIIEIEDEISVNTGIFEVESIGGVTLKDAFVRARYGIKIDILPTIHIQSDEEDGFESDEPDYVTLATDISFQTFKPNFNDRPDVTIRHLVNEVRIPDGQTVIIGGLRKKTSQDSTEGIPFLGELPGIGKLFSINEISDDGTEMFIFLTPKIIFDPCDDLERIKLAEMTRRPGDIPPFLCSLVAARDWERNNIAYGTMTMLFGPPPERCYYPVGEYDGR